MATFHLFNFGCRASQADGAALKRQLLDAGLEESAGVDRSQVAVLNTCTVTAAADAEARQLIRRIHRLNPYCHILVTGCYAQRAPDELARLPGVTWVVGNSHKQRIADLLKPMGQGGLPNFAASDSVHSEAQRAHLIRHGEAPLSKPASGVSDGLLNTTPGSSPARLVQIQNSAAQGSPALRDDALSRETPRALTLSAQVLVGKIPDEFHFLPVFPDDRTRPTLKIQDGCNARCSFCVIPSVRGRSRSLAPGRVIEQVRQLVANGYLEIVLSGINLGSYGKDLDRRITFLGLLERILAETSIVRLRISSLEPMDVSPELTRLVARERRMARHFHVPLQSGCDRILRLMNRRYWAAQYAERTQAIRDQIPDCGIGADVMVGFPGETDQDHSASMRLIESLPFTYLHIFPYSARPLTPASVMNYQVNGRVARERSKEIRAMIAEKRRAFLEAQIGRVLSVLTLDDTKDEGRISLSSNFLKVALPNSNVPRNTLLDVRAERLASDLIYALPLIGPTAPERSFVIESGG